MVQRVPKIHVAPVLEERERARPTPEGETHYPAAVPAEVIKVEDVWMFSEDNPHMPIGEFIRLVKVRDV